MAQIRTLKDYDNNVIYPQSVAEAIVNADGINLETLNQSFISSMAIEEVAEIEIQHENIANKVVSINNYSTNEQYPSAKAVYDLMIANKDVGINMEVVDSLPTENIDSKTIYLVQLEENGTYGMFVYVNEEWREVGSTEVDLSNYATKSELNTKADKTTVPTKVSQLINDNNYATVSQIPDVSNFATMDQIPEMTEYAKKSELNLAVPKGLICMWSGTIIPSGWALCNGTNGTPDLRDRFIVGSGGAYTTGNIGGSAEVILTTAQMPNHTHALTISGLVTSEAGVHTHTLYAVNNDSNYAKYPGFYSLDSGFYARTSRNYGSSVESPESGGHTHTISGTGTLGSTGGDLAHENRPPYYALAFIMKL